MLGLARVTLLDGQLGHLGVVRGVLEHVQLGHQAIDLQGVLVTQVRSAAHRIQQVLPVLRLRVVLDQPLELLRRALGVIELDAGAERELQRLVLRRLTGLDLLIDDFVVELESALVVTLQVVRLTDEGLHLIIGKTTLDGAVAVLDGLVVVLELIVHLRHGLDAAGDFLLIQEAVVDLQPRSTWTPRRSCSAWRRPRRPAH